MSYLHQIVCGLKRKPIQTLGILPIQIGVAILCFGLMGLIVIVRFAREKH